MTNQNAEKTLPLIVGVGASAGGLEAFQELLAHIDEAPGLAIIFVQHLDSSVGSLLPELLAKSTAMNVVDLQGRKKLKAGSLYVGRPQTLLEVKNGFVRPIPVDGERAATPIDHLFHSIAEDQADRGIGMILSGSGSDGTLGLKAISDCGGLTFAQDPASAKFDAMPRSAAVTGVADHVCSPAEIAAELLRYADHMFAQSDKAGHRPLSDEIADAIPSIAEVLYGATGHNFQHYKINTLSRRIQRRMQVLKSKGVSDYVDYLSGQEDEQKALFRELLIGVTMFFRDPDAFDLLRRKVLPALFEKRMEGDPVRIWVAGCANGAEAYTVAMLCHEVAA